MDRKLLKIHSKTSRERKEQVTLNQLPRLPTTIGLLAITHPVLLLLPGLSLDLPPGVVGGCGEMRSVMCCDVRGGC